MAEVELRSLRVSAQLDAGQYAAGAAQKVAADKAMVASGQQAAASVNAVGASVSSQTTKISQAGDVLSRLSRQYVDGYAAAQRFNSALNQLSTGLERGKISAEQTGPILDGIFRKYGLMGDAAQFAARGQTELATAITRANARLAEQQRITPANGNASNRFGSLNATSQFQDIAITSMMGQSPLTIALQQGTQLGMALEQQLGDQGVKGLVKGLGGAFMGLLTPINLLAIGLTGVVAVAIQFGSRLIPQVKSLKDATEDQRKAVTDLAEAYGLAGLKAEDFYRKSVIAAESDARRKNDELQKAADAATKDVLSQLTVGSAAGGYRSVAQSPFQPFSAAIKDFQQSHDYDLLEKDVAGVVALNPGLQTTGDKILGIAAAGAAAAAQLKNTAEIIKDINRSSVGNFDRAQQAGRNQSVMNQRFGDDPFAQAREQQRQKEIALTEAQDERKRSLDRTLDSARLDIELVGKTTAEVEGLRMAAELEAQVREEAAKNNVAVDQAEIALIRQKAAEYGKLQAIQQARNTIFDQSQDIELQRAELGLVGQNTLARDRSIAMLKAEQDIRKLGIDLYGTEAEAIRKNTAELASLAEAQAKANLASDLAFERRQMFRSPEDQQIGSRLQSAGLPDDLNSTEAAAIRANIALQQMKDTWQSIFDVASNGIDDVVDSLFEGGKDIGEVLKDVGRDFAKLMFNLALTNPLKNWLTGSNLPSIADLGIFGAGASSGKGGGFGGVLGNLLGAQKAVASMQVQAASVFINGAPVGGVAGGLGSLLGGQSGTPFQANTTLTDFLSGGGAANQNNIQTRIDQAFGTNGIAQDLIQGRIDQAFGTSGGLGGIFSPAVSTSASAASGGGVAGQVWNFFAGKGLAPHQIAGILGNVGAESGFNPTAVGDGGNALGLFQWNDRSQSMLNGIGGRGNLGNVQSQLDFAWKELQGPESQAFKALLGSKDVRGATSAFAGFERPKGFSWDNPEGAHNFTGRLEGAEQALAKFGDTTSSVTNAAGTTAQGLTSLGGGLSQFGSSLSSFMSSASGGGSSWFKNLSGLFGGASGAIGSMNSISPLATADILSGSWGLFHEGGVAGYPRQTRSGVDPRVFIGAPRYHNGGIAGDEVPAILKRGEPVFKSMEHARSVVGGNDNGNMEALVNALASKLKLSVKNINVFDPSVVGDYTRTDDGEQAVTNVMRRTGSGRASLG